MQAPILNHRPSSNSISENLSIYLDLMRFTAAFLVFLFHLGFFSGFRIPVIGNSGAESVLAFFVLSGFVIAFTATTRHDGLPDFISTRLARLWSIVIPALILTVLCDTLQQHLSSDAYGNLQPYNAPKWLVTIGANTLFLNQVWNLDVWPGSNGPFWSISYEFFYYCIFASAYYFRGWRQIVLTLFFVCVAGPKIMLELPVWLTGASIYLGLRHLGPSKGWQGASIWLGSLILMAAYISLHVSQTLHSAFPKSYEFSLQHRPPDFWPKSYIIGLIIALNIYGFDAVSGLSRNIIVLVKRPIRILAAASFGIYLFHYPLAYFFKATLWHFNIKTGLVFVSALYSSTFVASFFLGLLLDPLRKPIRNYFNRSMGILPKDRGMVTL